ncbi:MAG: hypothetical protein HY883_05310 [Deltaproteobacteria bacterium]|nr:hypothetical protein [Deltaproteobacteria bacterium]
MAVKTLRLLILVFLLFPVSCEGLQAARSLKASPLPSEEARVLFYIHSTSLAPADIEFTISSISLEDGAGMGVNVVDKPAEINSLELVDRQILLKEAFVSPGSYAGIRLGISSASIKSGEARASLSLKEGRGEFFLPLPLNLKRGESFVIAIEWNPDNSIEQRYIFAPALTLEPQSKSPRDLLLFVSNSADNYISVIDRSLERVIAATTVGRNPMGMALNSTGDTLYVVNSGDRTVSVVDAANFDVRDTVNISSGVSPSDVTFVPDFDGSIDGKLYVVNRLSNDVTVVGTLSKRVLKTVAVGRHPSHIISDAERKEVYVTNGLSNNLSVISTVDDTVVSTIEVDNAPSGAATGDGMVYVFNEGSSTISVVSPAKRGVEETLMFSKSPERGLGGFSGRLFVANTASDSVTFLNSSLVVTNTVIVGRNPTGLAADEERNRLYVTNSGGDTVSILDPVGEMAVKELTVGKGPYGVVQLDR